ncbi:MULTISPECIES: GNAT family N-acetyltransferase [Musicola]|uniref:GCN5-related N-acetyltransferase n=1 Tax=Musicola paradisiaca (strain Ech703) TaxID=579405 RepID=C6C5M6_MUSP7|nr:MULTISPECIES: GNAT family N-acetyltransferase [Musicola]ACS83839.1 GCN5-related N-acetyltransferase [Musicola paradisiaca Ech703]
MLMQWTKGEYLVSTDRQRLDCDAIYAYLTTSTWANGIDRETVTLSIDNSLCFGLFHREQQIGFARMVTDFATFGYLCDVFVLPERQGAGLGRFLVECTLAHPRLQRLRRQLLLTSTAPWLYQKVGYEPINRDDYTWTYVRHGIYDRHDAVH